VLSYEVLPIESPIPYIRFAPCKDWWLGSLNGTNEKAGAAPKAAPAFSVLFLAF